MAHKILPITKTTIEVAQFDIQKIKNPEIQGKEYQEGDRLGFWNNREYVLWRDGHKCKGKTNCKNKILNVHHIESRKIGGDAPNNLITLCEQCHDDYHLKALYSNVKLTYGYITKNARITNRLEKSHIIDARCISGNPLAKPDNNYYYFKQVRKQNRQLHKANPKKGIRQANKAPRHVHGYQLFDKVQYEGQECFIFGRRSSGYFDLHKLDGTKIHPSANYKKLRLLERASTLLHERRKGNSSPTYAIA